MSGHSPFAQFNIKPLFNLDVAGIDISYTNSSLFMTLAVILILSFFLVGLSKAAVIPNRLQNFAEIIYEFIEQMLFENTGHQGKKYFPIIFSVFLFILTCNLLGMAPYGFTVTSHIIVSFAIALFVFITITFIGLFNHGLKFFSFLLPHGTPWWLVPLMIIIELFSYLSRPVSLSVRLTANMIAGHVLLKVLAGFITILGLIWGFVPIPLIVILVGFEIFIAILQAYIFTILACVYLNDAINLH